MRRCEESRTKIEDIQKDPPRNAQAEQNHDQEAKSQDKTEGLRKAVLSLGTSLGKLKTVMERIIEKQGKDQVEGESLE